MMTRLRMFCSPDLVKKIAIIFLSMLIAYFATSFTMGVKSARGADEKPSLYEIDADDFSLNWEVQSAAEKLVKGRKAQNQIKAKSAALKILKAHYARQFSSISLDENLNLNKGNVRIQGKTQKVLEQLGLTFGKERSIGRSQLDSRLQSTLSEQEDRLKALKIEEKDDINNFAKTLFEENGGRDFIDATKHKQTFEISMGDKKIFITREIKKKKGDKIEVDEKDTKVESRDEEEERFSFEGADVEVDPKTGMVRIVSKKKEASAVRTDTQGDQAKKDSDKKDERGEIAARCTAAEKKIEELKKLFEGKVSAMEQILKALLLQNLNQRLKSVTDKMRQALSPREADRAIARLTEALKPKQGETEDKRLERIAALLTGLETKLGTAKERRGGLGRSQVDSPMMGPMTKREFVDKYLTGGFRRGHPKGRFDRSLDNRGQRFRRGGVERFSPADELFS